MNSLPPGQGLADFNEALLKAIDVTVVALTGPSVLASLYQHLKEFYDISREDLPNHLDKLLDVLSGIFGTRGLRTISRAIAVELYFRLKISILKNNYTLQQYVEDAKKQHGLSPASD